MSNIIKKNPRAIKQGLTERVVPEGVANVVRSEDRQMFCMVRGRWLKLRCEQQPGLALIMKRHAKRSRS